MSRNQALYAELEDDQFDDRDGPADEEAEEAWADEVGARVSALRRGEAEVVPFAEAVAAAQERLKARRG